MRNHNALGNPFLPQVLKAEHLLRRRQDNPQPADLYFCSLLPHFKDLWHSSHRIFFQVFQRCQLDLSEGQTTFYRHLTLPVVLGNHNQVADPTYV